MRKVNIKKFIYCDMCHERLAQVSIKVENSYGRSSIVNVYIEPENIRFGSEHYCNDSFEFRKKAFCKICGQHDLIFIVKNFKFMLCDKNLKPHICDRANIESDFRCPKLAFADEYRSSSYDD
jgi:hypothetical protein